eukprot:3757205-Heterocapsa_arctica.AAC.1
MAQLTWVPSPRSRRSRTASANFHGCCTWNKDSITILCVRGMIECTRDSHAWTNMWRAEFQLRPAG